jgi:hypothetical protein
MPSLLRDVQAHLPPTDPGRREFERIAHRAGNGAEVTTRSDEEIQGWLHLVDQERGKIVTAVRAASSAALRERIRLRSFRNIVVGTALVMTLLPVALAMLKLPTGAITAFLGLLLMRGQFVPGLSALDTSAQILAWALVFGYAQQLFTRLVDQQGQTVLNSIRAPDKPAA